MTNSNKDLITRIRGPKRNKFKNLFFEAEFLMKDLVDKTRRATIDYQGNFNTYEQNKNRAILGFGVGGLSGLLFPPIGMVGISYGGLKAYQAYKDHNVNRDSYFYRDERRSE